MRKKHIIFTAALLLYTVSFSMNLPGFDITEKTGIVLAKKPSKSSVLAASELSKYIEKVSGIKLLPGVSSKGDNIYIGLASDFKDLPANIREKLEKSRADDSYAVHVSGSRMYFAGKNKPAELYAVYQFLDRELGIRFFKPANQSDSGEYIPYRKRARIKIADGTFIREPAYRRRLLFPTAWDWWTDPVNGVVWSVKGGFQMQPTYFHRWRAKRKNAQRTALYEPRTADLWEENEHCILQLAIPAELFQKHPEYFALINGKRTCSPNFNARAYCLSNPDVRRLTAEYIIRNIREKKRQGVALLTGDGMADMSRGFCECDDCRKENGGKLDWRNITNVHSKSFKAIFDQVHKEIPDAKLLHWAYHTYRTPSDPEIRFDDRVSLMFMTHGRCYAHAFDSSCRRNRQLREWLKEYVRRFRQVSVYEYLLWSGGRNYIPQELIQAQDLKFLHDQGVTGWQEEVFFEDSVSGNKKDPAAQQIKRDMLPSLWQWLYLTGKMLWDPDLDPQQVLNDAESKYYGKAYPAMKKYHGLRRKLWTESRGCFGFPVSNERLSLLLNDPEKRNALLSLLDQAEKLAARDHTLLSRIACDRRFLNQYWVAAHREFLRLQGKVIKAPAADEKIVLDGVAGEKIWKKAFYVSNFKETFTKEHNNIPPELSVSVGILSDRENLYFLVSGREPAMDRLQNGKDIWQKSSVEFMIHPQNASNEYYHLGFALDGTKYEARCPGNIQQKIGAESCCRKTKDGYIMEIRIPAAQFGDFRNGSIWKINIAVNRFVFDGKLIEGHYSLDGNLYHDVNRFYPLQIGSPIKVNGNFSRTEKNKRKYHPSVKVLEKVPYGWFVNLHWKNPVFGIKKDVSPYDETLYISGVQVNTGLPMNLKEGEVVTVSFEAKGKGKLYPGVLHYRKSKPKFLRSDPASACLLTDKWQNFTYSKTVGRDEYLRLALTAFSGTEAQVDNISISVK